MALGIEGLKNGKVFPFAGVEIYAGNTGGNNAKAGEEVKATTCLMVAFVFSLLSSDTALDAVATLTLVVLAVLRVD